MDELQARIRAFQAQRTESNQVQQPAKAMEAVNPEVVAEASSVELPDAPSGKEDQALPPEAGYSKDAVVKRSTSRRKSQTAAKRKSPTVAKTVVPVPFRQLREENQQPYVDELKRLEAQAERINQLLAERAQKKVQQRMPQQIVNGLPTNDIPTDGANIVRTGRAALPSPQRQAAKPSQPAYSPSYGEVIPLAAIDDAETEQLKAQANRINELLAELEATIRQTQTVNPAVPSSQPVANLPEELSPPVQALPPYNLHHPPVTIPPLARGQEQVASLRQDLQRDNQEAEETAQALRSLASREPAVESRGGYANTRQREGNSRSLRQGTVRPKKLGFRLRQLLQVPAKPMDRLGDAVLWVVLAAVARLGSRILLLSNPALTPIVVGLMLAPAALAVYLALFVPKAGFVSIYRLFLITLGLLLGSKL